jgi:hypothetical protein
MAKIDRYIQNIPKLFKPGLNPIITALLTAWAQEDDEIVTQLKNTKSQLFVKTANGQYLDRLASGLGVSREQILQLSDDKFRELIPNLSLKPKQVRKTIYETLDVFWGPLYSRANFTTQNYAPFNVVDGDQLIVKIDGGEDQDITIQPGDIAVQGAATADEIATVLSRISGATVSVITDTQTGNEYVNIRTNTVGSRGSVYFYKFSMAYPNKLFLVVELDNGALVDATHRLVDLTERTCVYEIRNKELLIELPALVPILKDTLKGAHHFHANATLEAPVAPENGTWQGSFLYSRSTTDFTVTSTVATLQQSLLAGQVYTELTVDDASAFPEEGYLIFDWGRGTQEEPVRYIGKSNDQTLLLDPSHVFTQNHSNGGKVNYLSSLTAPTPALDGSDLAIFLVSPSTARQAVQTLLQDLVAAGVVVTFVVLLPDYFTDVTPNPYA